MIALKFTVLIYQLKGKNCWTTQKAISIIAIYKRYFGDKDTNIAKVKRESWSKW